jgi:hypothetical protein
LQIDSKKGANVYDDIVIKQYEFMSVCHEYNDKVMMTNKDTMYENDEIRVLYKIVRAGSMNVEVCLSFQITF